MFRLGLTAPGRPVVTDSDCRQVLGHRRRVSLAERLIGVDSRLFLVMPAIRLKIEESPAAGEGSRRLVAVREERQGCDVVDFVVVF